KITLSATYRRIMPRTSAFVKSLLQLFSVEKTGISIPSPRKNHLFSPVSTGARAFSCRKFGQFLSFYELYPTVLFKFMYFAGFLLHFYAKQQFPSFYRLVTPRSA